MNESLYIKDPECTELGRKILKFSVQLIHKIGFESFNFKKLADEIGTTEAGIYRFFENKYKLLIYITSWYFVWLETKIKHKIQTINTSDDKLKELIKLLAAPVEDDIQTSYIDENLLHSVIIAEGSKSFLTKQVNENHKLNYFQPYKNLCTTIGNVILEINAGYKYPKSLASTIVEVAHFQNFFMNNIPTLTDFSKVHKEKEIIDFLQDLVFSCLKVDKE